MFAFDVNTLIICFTCVLMYVCEGVGDDCLKLSRTYSWSARNSQTWFWNLALRTVFRASQKPFAAQTPWLCLRQAISFSVFWVLFSSPSFCCDFALGGDWSHVMNTWRLHRASSLFWSPRMIGDSCWFVTEQPGWDSGHSWVHGVLSHRATSASSWLCLREWVRVKEDS